VWRRTPSSPSARCSSGSKTTCSPLTPFGQNVAVVKYEREGKIDYLVRANDPGKLHSEIEAVNELERLDRGWQRTQILEVYTERHPCANCWPNLRGVRERIKRIRAEQGKPATDLSHLLLGPQGRTGQGEGDRAREAVLHRPATAHA